jgi:hypothetical protein
MWLLHTLAGVDVVNENNPRAWVVLNIIYVMGLLSFAAVLGILTDDIGNAVDRVRGWALAEPCSPHNSSDFWQDWGSVPAVACMT